MEVAGGITTHSVVLCIDKRERGLVLESLLKKKGFKVITVTSLYEGLKNIQQEMPHLVISDSILKDGTAGTLYDRLAKHPMLQSTPILVLVAKKTREQLTPLTGRKFAGFMLGQFDGPALLSKIAEVMRVHSDLSPHFVPFSESGEYKSEFNISIDSSCLGLSSDQVVFKSTAEIDGAAALVCLPEQRTMEPVILKMGSNLVEGPEIFNMFPLSRIRGKGRKWISELPAVELEPSPGADERIHRVVFFDPNQKRSAQFKQVLSGYNIDLIHADSMQKATQLLMRDGAELGCAYFHELTGPGEASVKEALGKLRERDRPPIIVGTSSLNIRSTNQIRYIKRPFGLGILVEMMEAAFKVSGGALSEEISKAHEAANVPCDYKAPAKLIGLDETGGIVQLKFPVVKGNRLRLDHPFLDMIWEGDILAEITHLAALPQKPDIWQARFVAVSSKGNKVKYWEKVTKILREELGSGPQGKSA